MFYSVNFDSEKTNLQAVSAYSATPEMKEDLKAYMNGEIDLSGKPVESNVNKPVVITDRRDIDLDTEL